MGWGVWEFGEFILALTGSVIHVFFGGKKLDSSRAISN
jgi:hypothetical protein